MVTRLDHAENYGLSVCISTTKGIPVNLYNRSKNCRLCRRLLFQNCIDINACVLQLAAGSRLPRTRHRRRRMGEGLKVYRPTFHSQQCRQEFLSTQPYTGSDQKFCNSIWRRNDTSKIFVLLFNIIALNSNACVTFIQKLFDVVTETGLIVRQLATLWTPGSVPGFALITTLY